MSSLNSTSRTSSSQKKNTIPSSSSAGTISPVRKDKEKNVEVENTEQGQSSSEIIKILSEDIKDTDLQIGHMEISILKSKEIKKHFNSIKKKNISSNNLLQIEKYYLEIVEKFKKYKDILLQLNNISKIQDSGMKYIHDLCEKYQGIILAEGELQKTKKQISFLDKRFNDCNKEKISIYRECVRMFARQHEPSFLLEKDIKKFNSFKNDHGGIIEYISSLNSAISHYIVSLSRRHNDLISNYKNETFLPLWDQEVPEIKKFHNIKELCQYHNIDKICNALSEDSMKKEFLMGVRESIDYNIQTLEEKALQCSNDMMMLLLQEEEKEKQKQHMSLSALSISPKQEFISTIQQDDSEVSENISETGASSKPLPEEDYNQKLQAQWKNYFKDTDYRKGHWSGKGGILIPVMENNFPPQMRFMLSVNTVMAHLEKRHPDVVQTLSRAKKGKIKDKDGFESVISAYKQEIHNLIFDLALQLSDKETFIYKSEFYSHPETHEKIPNSTIMVRGKNKAGDIMLSAWGLYEAEKSDTIKLHLVSYYKDNNPNKKLPHAMNIFAFADGEALQKTKAQFEQIKKGKGKKKKS